MLVRQGQSWILVLAVGILLIVAIAVTICIVLRRRDTVQQGVDILASARIGNVSVESLCFGFPFKRIVDGSNRFVAAAIGAPFRNEDAQQRALLLRQKGVPLVGFCHYQNFPGDLRHNRFEDDFHFRHPLDYVNLMCAWGTCFRHPSLHGLGEDAPPVIDLVESDYAEPEKAPSTSRRYDFAYLCLSDAWSSCDDGWQAYCRNG